MLHAEHEELKSRGNKQLEKADKPTACSSRMVRFGLSLSAYLHTKRIVSHSFAIDLALSLDILDTLVFQCTTGSGLGTRPARLRSEGPNITRYGLYCAEYFGTCTSTII